MPDAQQEERIEKLEEALAEVQARLAAAERKSRGGGFGTGGIPSLVTDLDDLGTVKTFLEFDEAAAPDTPQAGQLRLYAKAETEGARLVVKDEAGVRLWPFCTTSDLQFIQSYVDVTVANGASQGLALVTHNTGWSTVGRVHLTIQNADALATAERPCSAHAYQVAANTFRVVVNLHQNAAAARGVRVGWIATGVL